MMPLQVAEPVTVGVGEATRVDLVDDGLPPPVGVRLGIRLSHWPAYRSRSWRCFSCCSKSAWAARGRAPVYLMAPRIRPDITQRWATR